MLETICTKSTLEIEKEEGEILISIGRSKLLEFREFEVVENIRLVCLIDLTAGFGVKIMRRLTLLI